MGKVWSIILRIPLWLLVIASCATSFYTAYTKMSSWAVPAIYVAAILLYILGISFKDKTREPTDIVEEPKVNVQELKDVEDEYQALQSKQNEVEDEGDNP